MIKITCTASRESLGKLPAKRGSRDDVQTNTIFVLFEMFKLC